MTVDRCSRSTRRKTHGIPNIAWKEGECTVRIGIPNGRFSALPGLGIPTRRTGLGVCCLQYVGCKWEAMTKRAWGLTDFTPSIPAVFLPWFS